MGLIYSLLLSLLYKPILRLLNGKMSSLRGFLIVYIIAIYTPITIYMARVSTYMGILFLIAEIIFLITIALTGENALKKSPALRINILDLSMVVSTIISTLLLLHIYAPTNILPR